MRNMLVLAGTLVAAAALAAPLGGCDGGGSAGGSGGGGGGGSDGGGGAGGALLTVADACKSLSSAVCAHLDTCSPFLIAITYGDKATCEERVLARCDDPTELASSNVTAAELAACAGAYEARTCAELLAGSPAECRVPGDKDNGATCATAAECKSTNCQADAEGSCGKCAPLLAEGDSCAAEGAACALGLYCNPTTTKCDLPAETGEACSAEKFCAAGLSCNAGKCGATLGEGADCSSGEVCSFGEGLLCLALTGTCTKVQVAKVGEDCGYDMATGAVSTCAADARCDDVTDKCVARPKGGEACTVDADTGNGDCATGWDCIGGTCSEGFPQCD